MSYNTGTGPGGCLITWGPGGCLITWGLGLVSYNMRNGPGVL